MRSLSSVRVVLCAVAAAVAAIAPPQAQTPRGPLALRSDSLTDLRAHGERIERLLRERRLQLRSAHADTLVPGRRIERADQYHQGIRVFGADVVRQLSRGQVVSVFGAFYEELNVETTPQVTDAEARRIVGEAIGTSLAGARSGELVVLPRPDGSATLTWRVRAAAGADLREYFVDARTGAIIFEYSNLQTQTAVGTATGTLGDFKKMSARRSGSLFVSQDTLRPPLLRTFDMRGNPQKTLSAVNGLVVLGASDLGSDTDNTWTDGPLSDAHIYTGYTYDYLFKRFGRRGLDDADLGMSTLVHPVRREDYPIYGILYPQFYANAAYYGDGMMVYGVGLPPGITSSGRTWNYTSAAIDIVAHEVSHGVTDFSSRLIYMNESGALNESFSDIMGAAVEFMFQPAGGGSQQADYLIGEDAVEPSGIRSMSNPAGHGHPDHYSQRFTGTSDNGGVHINSSIPNHVFYLAVQGGTNRVSGLTVQGVGASNRVQIETIFYRAVTQLLPANANFSLARAATIQAARDLYGANSAAERAMIEAWTAVGVN